jgi:acyl-CoA thioester hydrolase
MNDTSAYRGWEFFLPLRVMPEHLDPQGHVNNVTFVRFIQEAAVAHWLAAAPPELQSGIGWVVRRHEIDYLRPGQLGDELVAKTWVGEPSGATWERFTEIQRVETGQILVKARTVWVLLDANSGRPRRVDARMISALRRADGESPR